MDIIQMKYECDSTNKRYPLDSIPSLEDYAGSYDFNIELNEPHQGKSSSFYSTILRQVFIGMNKVLLVNFSLNEDLAGLYIRAVPVYASPDYSALPVNRCTVHSLESDPKGTAHANGYCNCSKYDNVGHVIRCQSSEAQYYYDDLSGRHSVIVPLRRLPPGSHCFSIPYYFACKTSCPRGMQRRPINVVFTLETACGDVLGRRVLGVRICTCPKRDKERVEKDATKRKKITDSRPAKRSKKSSNSSSCAKNNDNIISKLCNEMNELVKALGEFQDKFESIAEYIDLL